MTMMPVASGRFAEECRNPFEFGNLRIPLRLAERLSSVHRRVRCDIDPSSRVRRDASGKTRYDSGMPIQILEVRRDELLSRGI